VTRVILQNISGIYGLPIMADRRGPGKVSLTITNSLVTVLG
jgi:hypothetical protein